MKYAHTTLYLSEGEFKLLVSLPANVLKTKRSIFSLGEFRMAIDALPCERVTEVTHDERFTGGKLACTSAAGLRILLKEYGVV